jgi:formate dehydrogenase iron-sulfur subunit
MDSSRRQFLKTLGLTAATAAVTATTKPLFGANLTEPDELGERLAVLTDTTQCIGLNCRRCEIACRKENDQPPIEQPPEDETVFAHVRRTHENQFTIVNRYPNAAGPDQHPVYVKKQCMHCEQPACASACFVKALKKTPQGPVIYDETVCVGCRYCMVACPFDVPAYEFHNPLSPRVRKCTMCWATRTSHGEKPACVAACPKEVMSFGKRKDLIKLAYQRISDAPGRYVPHVYGENEIGGTSWLILAPQSFDSIGLPEDLGEAGLPEYPRNYLSAAPLILAMWPVFFGGIYLFTKRREQLMKDTLTGHGEGDATGEEHH